MSRTSLKQRKIARRRDSPRRDLPISKRAAGMRPKRQSIRRRATLADPAARCPRMRTFDLPARKEAGAAAAAETVMQVML
jgi:hypothetical protein